MHDDHVKNAEPDWVWMFHDNEYFTCKTHFNYIIVHPSRISTTEIYMFYIIQSLAKSVTDLYTFHRYFKYILHSSLVEKSMIFF